MKSLHRIVFYIKHVLREARFVLERKIKRYRDKEIRNDVESNDNPSSEKSELEEDCELPDLDATKTMAFHPWFKNHRCNFLTAKKYRRRICTAIEWGIANGIEIFLVDYTTPFGLLALETLLEKQGEHGSFKIYVYQTEHFRKRRSYRIVKETPVELCLLAARADYFYGTDPVFALIHVLPRIAVHYSEGGMMIIEKNCRLDIGFSKQMKAETYTSSFSFRIEASAV